MEGDVMPLSEHEQKILTDLEASLLEHDPHFAKSVGNINLYARRRRRTRLSIAGFIVGLIVLVTCFTRSVPSGLLGVAMMMASCIAFADNFTVADRE